MADAVAADVEKVLDPMSIGPVAQNLALQRAIHGKWMQEKSLLLVKD